MAKKYEKSSPIDNDKTLSPVKNYEALSPINKYKTLLFVNEHEALSPLKKYGVISYYQAKLSLDATTKKNSRPPMKT